MEKEKDQWNYLEISVNHNGCVDDHSLDSLLDFALRGRTHDEKIEYLNEIIADIEYYRDHLE